MTAPGHQPTTPSANGKPYYFRDRRDAGLRLAAALMHLKPDNPVVLALPRGGVPIGYEVASALDGPLDVLLVRKIGAPGHEELGLGAVVDGENPQVVLNPDVMRIIEPSPDYMAKEEARQFAEIERRKRVYRRGHPALPVKDRCVIVVDDGIATGGTIRAALQGLSQAGAARIVLGVPVGPVQVVGELSKLADEVVCLLAVENLDAVGRHYLDFSQTDDEEVIALLQRATDGGWKAVS